MALTRHVEVEMVNSKTASAAVKCLEDLRDGRTLPQRQVALHPKGRRMKTKSAGEEIAAVLTVRKLSV